MDAEKALKQVAAVPAELRILRRGEGILRWQSLLRRQLRSSLDIVVLPVWRLHGRAGGQVTLSISEMEEAYERRRQHMAGYKKTLRWSIRSSALGECLRTPRRGFCFWYGASGGVGGSVPVRLPPTFVTGVMTAVRNSGLEIVLLSYQTVANVPAGVISMPATTFLEEEHFYRLLGRVPVQCLADLVRARAMQRGVRGAQRGPHSAYVRTYGTYVRT